LSTADESRPSTGPDAPGRAARRAGLLRVVAFGALACLLAFFFHTGGGWNPVSRLLTVYGLVEDGSFVGDRWKSETGDYAEVGIHIYSDKAPGSSFVTLPFYWVYRRLVHRGPQTQEVEVAGQHLADFAAASLPFGVFAMLVLLRVRREGLTGAGAVGLAAAGVLGTCLLAYGGEFFGHMLAATCFLGAYVLACEREQQFALAGALGGLAVLTEYPLAVTQVIAMVYLLTGPDRWRRAFAYGLGALPMAAFMVAYNKAITGGWFDFPYAHVPAMWAAMRTDFGMRLPDPQATWELVFGQYRGMAFYAPILLVGVPALVARFAGPARRRNLVLVQLGAYLLLISSYFKWDGGWCIGPRHLAPFIILAAYEGTAAVAHLGRGLRWGYAALALFGATVAIAGASTDPMPNEGVHAPFFDAWLPRWRRGELNEHNLLVEHLPRLHNGGWVIAAWFALAAVGLGALAWWASRGDRRSLAQPASEPAAPLAPGSSSTA
jgi:hypothetical protein